MSMPVAECGFPVNFNASGDLSVGSCKLLRVLINSTSSGTLVFRRGGSGGTVLNGTLTPAAGQSIELGWDIGGVLHVTVGGTINATAVIIPEGPHV